LVPFTPVSHRTAGATKKYRSINGLYVPQSATWLSDLRHELLSFPAGPSMTTLLVH
jgi:hypothetical protein